MSVTPAAVNVNAGTTASATVSIGFLGGLTGSVAVQASGLPAGVTANFAPNSVNANGSITVSFFAQPSTPAESGTVTITGTNGQGATAITHTVTVALTVGGGGNTGNPAFSLSSTAATLSVRAGASATDTITVTDSGGFTGAVNLTATGMPTGVTATFGTNPATASSVLTVTAPSTAAAGSFMLTITGTGTSAAGTALTATTTIAVTITTGTTGGGSCHIGYSITNQWVPGVQVALSITNTSATAINGWTLSWTSGHGQTITQLWNGAGADRLRRRRGAGGD